jgi:acyl phosphate:glycerol-3-phosphate acyltransferase
MTIVFDFLLLLLGYLLGAIPFGLIIVKLGTGKDVRKVESGRTGGTNAYRAAGLWAGVLTGFLDGAKGAVAVWVAAWLSSRLGGATFGLVCAGLGAILGHNYSIFLAERGENGRWRLRGGAGGATAAGGAVGLWFPSIFFLVPGAILTLYFSGYASMATLSIPMMALIVFAVRAYLGYGPWVYVLYGVLAEVILLWALRPNLKRLMNGTERMVGPRAKKRAAKAAAAENGHGSGS